MNEVTQADQRAAEARFTEYFVRNYPGPNTVIHNPHWHAPRIFRAAVHGLATLSDRDAVIEECAGWHDQRAKDTPDAFEMELHQVSATSLRALKGLGGAGLTVTDLKARIAALEQAGRHLRPYLDWTIGPESPGYHPTMPSAVSAFKDVFGATALDSRAALQASPPTGGRDD